MKKLITKAALLVGAGATAVALATPANADYSWVPDESASICSSLSLQKSLPSADWITTEISMLQLSHDIGRAEAVAGIRQAATGYCPQHLSVVPAR